jgi:hypothetical protein
MPKWWPWGRSKQPDPKPAAPAIPQQPAWHGLPAVQRTVGDIEPTAHLQGFTASLTTSQNPGFTRPLDLLAAQHADQLPVLDLVHDSAGAAAAKATPSAAPTPKSRTWAPSPTAVQRTLRESTATVQRTADVAPHSVRKIRSVAAVETSETPPHSMVESPQPDDRRMLEVARLPEIGVEEPQSVEFDAPESSCSQEDGAVDAVVGSVSQEPVSSVSHNTSSIEPSRPPVQRLPSTMDPSLAAPQAISATSAGTTTTTASSLSPPLRHLPTIPRAAAESISAPEGFASARPIPVLRTIESAAAHQPLRKPDTATPAGSGGATLQRSTDPDAAHTVATDAGTPLSEGQLPVMPTVDAHHPATTPPPVSAQRITTITAQRKPGPAATTPATDSGTTLQRSTDPDPTHPIATDAATPSPAAPLPPSTPVSASQLPVMPTVDTHHFATTPPPVSAQRITTTTAESKPAPGTGHSPGPDAVAWSRPAAETRRVPEVEAHAATTLESAQPGRRTATLPTVQRWPEWSTDTVTSAHIRADKAPGVSEGEGHSPACGWGHLPCAGEHSHPLVGASERSRELDAGPTAAAPARGAPPTLPAGVMQRVTLPTVRSGAASTPTELPPTSSHSDSSPSAVVQRAATGGRLVVLPPVRSSSSRNDAASDPSSGPTGSVLFESPRPVGLQRMFEHTVKSGGRATNFGSAGSAPAGYSSAAFSRDSYSSESDSGAPRLETSGPSYDSSTNTIAFSSPTVQREPEAAPQSPEPAPAAASAATTIPAAAAAGPAPGQDVDELVNRLYDPLAARLRAELWLDRERAGVLMDLGR